MLCVVLNLRAYLLTPVLGAMCGVDVQGDMGLLARLAWACALYGLGGHLQLFALRERARWMGWASSFSCLCWVGVLGATSGPSAGGVRRVLCAALNLRSYLC